MDVPQYGFYDALLDGHYERALYHIYHTYNAFHSCVIPCDAPDGGYVKKLPHMYHNDMVEAQCG